jgi:hypothetical protein
MASEPLARPQELSLRALLGREYLAHRQLVLHSSLERGCTKAGHLTNLGANRFLVDRRGGHELPKLDAGDAEIGLTTDPRFLELGS